MCGGPDIVKTFPDLLRDPLIRLVMASDGISEQEMRAVMNQLRRVLAARETERRSSARHSSGYVGHQPADQDRLQATATTATMGGA
jgi:ABC-type phosphonate transport system ATPase subunit